MTLTLPTAPRKRAKHPTFTAAEFFAGIGLVRLAIERQGFRVVFANDIDPDKLEMYEANFIMVPCESTAAVAATF